jgi:dienelactone hydrolase
MKTHGLRFLSILFGLSMSLGSAYGFFGGKKEDLSLSEQTIDFWQPDTEEAFVIPARPYDLWDYAPNLYYARISEFKRIIPTYNNKGTLFASWTPYFRCFPIRGLSCPPKPAQLAKRPTFIIMHGGHGITPTNLENARLLKGLFNANVLILDSFWSRGKFENHNSATRLGANTRVLDLIAALRWLETRQVVDRQLIYVIGDSLGGQAVIRALTADPFIERELKGRIKAGFALYPYCREAPQYGGLRNEILGIDLVRNPWLAPALGPKYHAPLHVFTGSDDEPTDITICDQSIFKGANSWHHYQGATHAWDIANRGAGAIAVDGECTKAKNPNQRYRICRSDKVTNDVFDKIKTVVDRDLTDLGK